MVVMRLPLRLLLLLLFDAAVFSGVIAVAVALVVVALVFVFVFVFVLVLVLEFAFEAVGKPELLPDADNKVDVVVFFLTTID